MTIIRSPFLRRIYSWGLPLFFIIGTLFIIVMNDLFGDGGFFAIFSLLFFMTMTVFIVRWLFRQTREILTLKKEKKQAELSHLKSQVNPHFFFNTLNNLYGLVGQDTEKAQRLILKLSDMMRYSIYEGANEWVTLREEIAYMEDYIDLHKMRYHKKIEVSFEKNIESEDVKVMPLLFIILLENAFKHGVEHLRTDAYVQLKLQTAGKMLDFEIENNFDPEENAKSGGIGMANLRRRLELAYANRHSLKTEVESDVYRAKLSLQL